MSSVENRAAELIVMFEESVLEVRHLRPMQRYCVGARADLSIAGLGEAVELVRVGMSGEIELVADNEDAARIEILVEDRTLAPSWTREVPGGRRVALLPAGARARCTFGAISVLVQSAAPPRTLELPPPIDWNVHRVTAMVAILFGLGLAAINAIPPSAGSLSIDSLLSDTRAAKILFLPPVPPPAPAQESGEATAAGGAAAPRRVHSLTPVGGGQKVANNHPLKIHAEQTRELAAQAAAQSPLLALLGDHTGTTSGAIFGPSSALSDDATTVLGGPLGLGNGDGGGPGNGLVSGRGGDGVNTVGVGPVGNGRIGPGGGGSCAGCTGGHSVGSLSGLTHRARAPEFGDPETRVTGSIDKEIIRRIVRRHLQEMRYCYEHELEHNAQLFGRVVTRFSISAEGRVLAAVTASSTLGDSTVDSCVAAAFRRLEFPRVQGASGLTTVTYPLAFQSAGH